MVLTPKEAMEQRFDNSDISDLVDSIDEFLGTVEASESGCDLGDVEGYERDYITTAYTEVGWEVRWEEGPDGAWIVWMKPREDKR